MKSPFALILALLSFLLLACCYTESRKDPAGEYWRNVMKNQPMPEAIHALIIENSGSSTLSDDKTNCHGNANAHDHRVNVFIKEFEPTPNVTAYLDDKITDAKIQLTRFTGDVSTTENMSFAKDFEPTPNVTAYND